MAQHHLMKSQIEQDQGKLLLWEEVLGNFEMGKKIQSDALPPNNEEGFVAKSMVVGTKAAKTKGKLKAVETGDAQTEGTTLNSEVRHTVSRPLLT